jgi:16S rRNA (guanine527-N7)-methyltransferase
MEVSRIAELLQPFLGPLNPCHSEQSEESAVLTGSQLEHISIYIDILLRWNARINLTAVREPEKIVTRHFGESLFAARYLFPARVEAGLRPARAEPSSATSDHLVDVGSGAGFPGLPIKIWAQHIRLTLIESNQKKATFLREMTRALTLTDVNVFPGRTEDFPAAQADVVTLRAVERFEAILPVAARLVAPAGRLALLIGQAQANRVPRLAPDFQWPSPLPIPLSSQRVLLLGTR